MKMNKLTAFVAGTALAALAAGCTDTANTNTNANTANSNTAVVVNNNGNANTSGVSTTNANTANTNANSSTRASYNANITREEYEKDKDRYGQEAKSAGDKVGATATDGWLWVKTKAALTAVDDLRDSTINVDVEDGVITLRGNVANADQVKKADAATKAIEGKKSVKNMLKVAAAGDNSNANANASKSNTNTK